MLLNHPCRFCRKAWLGALGLKDTLSHTRKTRQPSCPFDFGELSQPSAIEPNRIGSITLIRR